jgi:hypothetical protein
MVSRAVGQKIKRQLKTVRDGDDLLLWASRLIIPSTASHRLRHTACINLRKIFLQIESPSLYGSLPRCLCRRSRRLS